jgi:tetratricopeptide (TPR) repeat protein
MRAALPSLKPLSPALGGMVVATATCEAVLGQVLVAHRTGNLDALLRRRPRATRWFLRRFAAPALAAAGDAFAGESSSRAAVQVLLVWALAQLRPDAAPLAAPIDRAAWLDLIAWRPLLALACHHGFIPTPDFRDRYRARPDESPADRLCGLWDVAPSSFYRYVEKGRRLVADVLLDQPLPADRLLSLYAAVTDAAGARLHWPDPAARSAWHVRQADAAAGQRDARAALWHGVQAQDAAGVTRLLQRFCNELAADPSTDAVLRLLPAAAFDARTYARLLLANAALARVRGAAEQERRECEHALRLAAADDDKLMLGIVYGALGKYHEARDIDRAFACFHESAGFLDQVDATESDAAEAYLVTLVHLAWLYALRNDPRARTVLERAETLRAAGAAQDDTSALLEQAWGEYWRRSGDLPHALEAKHRALQIYERTGNLQQVLRTYGNLALLYGQARDHARAIDYSQRVLAMAETTAVDPETVASTHINLGAALVWQDRLDEAIEQYRLAADGARAARLRVVAGRAHYNLAEAYYLRFKALGRPEDEHLGDTHTEAALAAWPDDGEPGTVQATRDLKREVLGDRRQPVVDQLLSGELAAHFDETSEVQRQRARLAVPQPAASRVEAHLAIAAAYVAIGVKEREAAVALIDEHRLHERFDAQVDALRDAFDRALTREQQLARRWARDARDVLAADRSAPVLRHLAEAGSINKRTYAQLCSVGPATASKHLGLLADRGLLVQTGRGPSTRYTLPP